MEHSVLPYMSPQEQEHVQPPAGACLQHAMDVAYLHVDAFFLHGGTFHLDDPLELIAVQ